MINIPHPIAGYVHVRQILRTNGLVPVSRSSSRDGVQSGRYPRPVKFGSRIIAWAAPGTLALLAASIE